MKLVYGVAGVIALAGAGVFLVPSCGGGSDPFCGDGVRDPGEECDDGNQDEADGCTTRCTAILPTQLRVKWIFNKGEAKRCKDVVFDKDSCGDLGVFDVLVEMIGPVTVSETESCGFNQVVFQDLPVGTYLTKISPRDINGELLVSAPVEATVVVGAATEWEINVPSTAWTKSYTGTLFFRVKWGGADCSAASPPVGFQLLRLEQNGTPVSINTQVGDPLDGSATSPCRPLTDEFSQSALAVPMGPATFKIVGRATTGGMDEFSETFDTFVGAGIGNCELELDVNSTQPDAGVPDAGVPADAGVADASGDASS